MSDVFDGYSAPDVPEAETQVFAAALAQELKREDGQ
mgnify:CR=1 FL=1